MHTKTAEASDIDMQGRTWRQPADTDDKKIQKLMSQNTTCDMTVGCTDLDPHFKTNNFQQTLRMQASLIFNSKSAMHLQKIYY